MLSDKDLPKHGDLIGDKYLVEALIGMGGMSAVFEVSHRVTNKRFALKWMLPSLSGEPEAVERFIREARVAGRVDHPNVVEVYDVGQQDTSFYMVMEFMEGESLASRLGAGRLTPLQACEVVLPTAYGVAAAHAAGVIHRDLKPQNIFLARGPNGAMVPKVLDFGISKIRELQGQPTVAITREGTIIGTPHYMAPEQILGHEVDERSDVYGLGLILYEALTGELPFEGNSYGELMVKITTTMPEPLTSRVPTTPRALVEIVNRAMARERRDRFATVSELARALERLKVQLEDETVAYTPTRPALDAPGPKTPLASESRRRNPSDPHGRFGVSWRRSLPLAAALLVLAAIGAALWRQRESVKAPAAVTILPTESRVQAITRTEIAPPARTLTSDAGAPQPRAARTLVAPSPPSAAAPPRLPAPATNTAVPASTPERKVRTPASEPPPPPAANVARDPARASKRRTHTLTDADF